VCHQNKRKSPQTKTLRRQKQSICCQNQVKYLPIKALCQQNPATYHQNKAVEHQNPPNSRPNKAVCRQKIDCYNDFKAPVPITQSLVLKNILFIQHKFVILQHY